jgi:hypothetical protein
MPDVPKDMSKKDWIPYCMGNESMKKEFPDQKQRLAVCFSKFKQAHPHSKADLKDISIIKIGTDFFLF